MNLKESLFRLSGKKGLEFSGSAAYSLCAGAVSLIFRTTPEIRSAYLAGSMAGGDIVPGLSDIDFVIVVKVADGKNEYEFLRNLEKKIRYLLPPFGKDKIGTHVVIYSDREWALLGDIFLGKRFGSPLRVFEKDKIILTNYFSPPVKALHHFYKAYWRLETIEQDIAVRPKDCYELQLRERLMERCFRSILNGVNETGNKSGPSARLSGVRSEIEEMLVRSGELKSDGLHPDILARLLYYFDLAVGEALPPPGLPEGKVLSPENNPVSEEQIPSERRFVRDPSLLLERETENCPVLYCPIKNTDYFVYDLSRYNITDKLIEYYRSNNGRGFRMLSKALIENLYLNFPEHRVVFTGLGDHKLYTLRTRLDEDRFVLEAYSIFPQLRSPYNFRDSERYEAFRDKARKLIRLLSRIQTGGKTANETLDNEGIQNPENSRKEQSEFERFNNLRETSIELRDKLNSFLSSPVNSHA